MKKTSTILIAIIASQIALCGYGRDGAKKIDISDNITVMQLTDNLYLYTATEQIGEWGLVPSNGMIAADGETAYMLDTPMSETSTRQIVEWVREALGAKITGFIANHWHGDCMGGLHYLHSAGTVSYASDKTIAECNARGIEAPQQAFADTLTLYAGSVEMQLFYPGGAHARDNIVVWFPAENILFAGCMVKDLEAESLGNTEDASLEEWPGTMQTLLDKYPSDAVVIPGHGAPGGTELIRHTITLLQKSPSLHP